MVQVIIGPSVCRNCSEDLPRPQIVAATSSPVDEPCLQRLHLHLAPPRSEAFSDRSKLALWEALCMQLFRAVPCIEPVQYAEAS